MRTVLLAIVIEMNYAIWFVHALVSFFFSDRNIFLLQMTQTRSLNRYFPLTMCFEMRSPTFQAKKKKKKSEPIAIILDGTLAVNPVAFI